MPRQSSRNISDAEPELQRLQAEIQKRFQSHFPEWELRPTTVFRSPEDQKKAFDGGFSNIDGIKKLGEHNYYPSRAIDNGIFRKKDGAWLDDLLTKKHVSQEQYKGMYGVYGLIAQIGGLRWGGDWNANGITVTPDPEESLNDIYHIELRKR